MSLSASEVAALVAELSPRLLGRRVQKVHQTDPRTLLVDLGGRWLLLSAHPRASRLHELAGKPAAPDQPTALAMLLRKELGGARLTALAQLAGDRVVELSFSNGRRLIAELFGPGGDLVLTGEQGRVLGALRRRRGEPYAPPAPSTAAPRPPRFESSADVAAHYDRLLADLARAEAERRRLAERRKLERLVANLEADLLRTDEAAVLRRHADLLLLHLHALARGKNSVELPDFESGAPVEIALDPALSPRENADRLYRRARKLDSARAQLSRRLQEARDRLARDAIPTPPPKAPPRRREPAAEKLPYREFVSEAGDTIWVGKSARDNDALTFHHARGADLWLHTRDAPGSHVVVRATPGRSLDERTLLDAATLAAHFSSLRNEAQVDVQYTLRKHVRKAGAPGAVYVSDARTVRIRMEPARLDRLLGGPRNS